MAQGARIAQLCVEGWAGAKVPASGVLARGLKRPGVVGQRKRKRGRVSES